ncbi:MULTISPECIES: DUF2884 family protein [unclassified Gilliamella]|uniref:DUF2884 family protein n=1 Tax=unclassified Gilliamella TaxID=2685620 RepID=UPI002269E90F|nr:MULTISPECIES: DUF2884 family protein [unclassified Gilliamella]MCX8641171.1 DUF2884 family protein [Gilliamella sp. B3835]MCX8707070.1 DUF2884 family protein [Gilliamella sp. B3783]MCX8710433.1 DUF2884 family protein [Gilliamella sp. B3780]MCX8715115.1 DUF2884 family protein [Gilliamella sp. B3781]MCX8716053.1 DUF2884 family protein [Gilliamella sp. B3784]
MLKKLLLILLIFPVIAVAKQKQCAVKPSYDITITEKNVRIFNKNSDLTILSNGNVELNQSPVLLNAQQQKQTLMFQKNIRQQLPQLEQQALTMLSSVKFSFENAIKNKLGNDSKLQSELNKLYKRLVKLLHQSIITENGRTEFHYQNFNNLKKDGEEIGQRIFYNVVGGSLVNFNFFQNYATINEISKNEWKAQKPKLKAFDAHICSVITDINNQYQQILSELEH